MKKIFLKQKIFFQKIFATKMKKCKKCKNEKRQKTWKKKRPKKAINDQKKGQKTAENAWKCLKKGWKSEKHDKKFAGTKNKEKKKTG